VRVISGQSKGMRLISPRGLITRPTSDRVKEALFSILDSAGQLAHAVVLDLYAGSGALGIEALSRGAEHAVFVEKSRPALEALRHNLEHTRLVERSEVIALDSMQALSYLSRRNMRFDLILIDPPYQSKTYLPAIEQIGLDLLTPNGLLVAETTARTPLPARIGRCMHTDRRVYGDTALEFYIMEPNDAP